MRNPPFQVRFRKDSSGMTLFSLVSAKESLKCSISNERAPLQICFRENKPENLLVCLVSAKRNLTRSFSHLLSAKENQKTDLSHLLPGFPDCFAPPPTGKRPFVIYFRGRRQRKPFCK